jgi:hypothetical protein
MYNEENIDDSSYEILLKFLSDGKRFSISTGNETFYTSHTDAKVRPGGKLSISFDTPNSSITFHKHRIEKIKINEENNSIDMNCMNNVFVTIKK